MTKKNFKNNPALAFISTEKQELLKGDIEVSSKKDTIVGGVAQKPPKGYKFNPEYIETKSKRVQLLLQPSVVNIMKELAKKNGLSFNEACNEAIQEYLHNKYTK